MWNFEDPTQMIESAFVLLCSSQHLFVPEDEYKEAKQKWMDAYHNIWLSKMIKKEEAKIE